MPNGAYGAGATGAAAVAAAIAQATKASGAIVKMTPEEFIKILNLADKPLVVTATGGFMNRQHRYLTSYKGLFFYTSSKQPLAMPGSAQIIAAEKIWIPGQ